MGRVCYHRCKDLKKYSRLLEGIRICDVCNYCTKTTEIYCQCCRKKYRVRKTGNKASSKRSQNVKRM